MNKSNDIKKKIFEKNIIFSLLFSLALTANTSITALAENTNTANEATKTDNETKDDEPDLDAYSAYTTVNISSAEDLIDLADRCQDTSESSKLYVLLKKDISLLDYDFDGIPYFDGVFDGAGYTISGLDISGKIQPAGLIGITGENAVIINLNTSGNIKPSGKGDYVGGIVGINQGLIYGTSFNGVAVGKTYVGGITGSNEATGTIKNSTSTGAVKADTMAGGIAGINAGTINDCTNKALIDTESTDPSVNVSDIDISVDIANINTQSLTSDITDIGGICGYSSGTVRNSSNYGTVGYTHTGYNIGGIVGRSSGFVYKAANYGTVYGRKDVAGIAGQMEPYVSTNLSQSDLKKLSDEMDTMDALVDKLSLDAKTSNKDISKSTDNITGYISDIDSGAQSLYDKATDKVNSIDEDDVKSKVDGAADAIDNGVSDAIDKAKDEELPDTPDTGEDLPDINFPGREDEGTGDEGDEDAPDEDTADDAIDDEPETDEKIDIDTEEVKSTTQKVSNEIYSEIDKARESSKTAVENSKLRSNISGLNSEIKTLNSTLSGTNDSISADLDKINAQYDVIADIIENASAGDLVTDASQSNPANSTNGAMRDCVNEGKINGDVNVGGIAGSMAQESSIDPEDDIDTYIDKDTKKSYTFVTVIYDCINRAEIESQRNYTGGIAGRADIGYIASCESYGYIDATGDYVGGIAGTAAITIENCQAKTTITGASYVGGVLGMGITETVDDTGSLVSGCRALVDITDAQQFYAAIAGYDAGDFKDNYYTSDSLAGINRVSRIGEAENVDFNSLIADENLSEEFTSLSVKFMAEGTELKNISFDYGDSISESEFPELPQKEGYYAHWDKSDLSDLKIDTTVNAVYSSYISSLSAEPKRANGRSVFYVEGNFADDEAMTVEEAEASDFVSTSGEILEAWNISIPEDGLDEHTLRYLPISENDDIEIYIKTDSNWTQVDAGSVGNYLTIAFTGKTVSLLVIQKPLTTKIIIFIVALVLIFLGLIILNVKAIKNKKKKLKTLTAEKDLNMLDLSQDTESMTEEEIKINKRIDKAEKAVKKGAIAVRIIITILVTLLVAAVGLWIAAPEFINSAVAGYYLGKVATDDSLQCEVSVTVEDGKATDINALLTKTTVDANSYTVIEENGMTLYLSDSSVYLENGNGFNLSSVVPNYENALTLLSPLFDANTVTSQTGDGGRAYEITISDEDSLELLKILAPDISEAITSAGEMKISLVASNFEVERIDFEGQGTLYENEDISLTASIDIIDEDDRTELAIPSTVSDAVASGTAIDVELSPELMDLLMAYGQFRQQDPAACDVLITATGGNLSISDTMTWFRKQIDGQWVNAIGKNGINLYYTDKAACTEGGVTLTADQQATVDIGQILDIAYLLCQTADISTSENSYETYYEISLDEDSIAQLAEIIAPEIADSDFNLTEGILTFTVSDQKLTDISIEITGSVKLLIFTENVGLSADFKVISDPVEENYQIPSTASEVLIN